MHIHIYINTYVYTKGIKEGGREGGRINKSSTVPIQSSDMISVNIVQPLCIRIICIARIFGSVRFSVVPFSVAIVTKIPLPLIRW